MSRYLKRQRHLTRAALERLTTEGEPDAEDAHHRNESSAIGTASSVKRFIKLSLSKIWVKV